jgi:hypothetical protein
LTEDKKRRIATATGFLSGVLTCMDAVRDARVSWPPDALWAVLSNAHRLELVGGIALIVVAFVMSIVKGQSAKS